MMYRTRKGPLLDAVVGGVGLAVIIAVALAPLMPASWAVGLVFGVAFYQHMREEG